MIRVLHIMGWGLGYGIGTAVMEYYRNIDRCAVQFDFLVPGFRDKDNHYEPEAIKLGAIIYKYPDVRIGGNKKIKKILWLYKFIKKHPEYKIIHIHHQKPKIYTEVFLLAIFGAAARIVHSHSDFTYREGWDRQKFSQFMLRTFSTHICACSVIAGISLFGKKAVTRKKFMVIKNAKNLEPFKYNIQTREETLSKLNLADKFILINIGGLRTQKNQEFLLESFAIAKNKHENMVLLIAGEGKLRPELEKKAKTLELGDSVFFMGERNDVAELLQAADLFVLPSLYEGLPGAAIEAQAAGLPCLISSTVTNECKVTDNAEFLPIDEGPEIWAQRMPAYRNFVRKDTLEEVRRAGYDIKDAVKKLEEIYMNILPV